MKISFPDKLWTRMIIAVLVPVVVTGFAMLVVPLAFGLPKDAAFRVGDTVVTRDHLQERVEVLGALYGIQEPVGGPQLARFRRDAAKAVAVGMILDEAAASRDIVVGDKAARDALHKMISGQLGDDSNRAFVDLIGGLGVSEEDVLDEIKRQQRTASLFQATTADAVSTVTDDQLPRYYADHRAEFALPEQRRLRNIVVATKEKADQVLRQARSGASFAALAGRTTLDEETRGKKGDLGFVTTAQLETGYAKAAFAPSRPAVFGPVQTRYGWNVGQVVEIRPGNQLPFEQVRDDVRDALRSERALAAWREWLGGEISAARVEYADDYRPADPDAPPSGTDPLPAPATPSVPDGGAR